MLRRRRVMSQSTLMKTAVLPGQCLHQAQGVSTEEDPGWSAQMQAKQQLLPTTQCMTGWGQDGKTSPLEHTKIAGSVFLAAVHEIHSRHSDHSGHCIVSKDSVTDLCWAGARAAAPPTMCWVTGPKCLQSRAREGRWRGKKTQEVICQRSPQVTGTTVFWKP